MRNNFRQDNILFNSNWKKAIAAITILMINSASSIAQTIEPAKSSAKFPEWLADPVLYIVSSLFIFMLLTIYALYSANNSLMKILDPEYLQEKASMKLNKTKTTKVSFAKKTYLKLVDSVPLEKEKDIMLDHDYDGIKELDNNLPPWWKYGFYVTIVFSFFYLIIYHATGTGKLQEEEYNDELKLAEQQREERLRLSAENVNEETVTLLADPVLLKEGKATFEKFCAACHKPDGGGQVGPNLTDEYWLHGGGIHNVFKTITYGVPDKGMLSWKSQLAPKQIQQIASYILSLQGSNPAGAKEAQGEKWIEIKTDTLKTAIDSSASTKIADNITGGN